MAETTMHEGSLTLNSFFAFTARDAKARIAEAVDSEKWEKVHIPRVLRAAAAGRVAGLLDTLLNVSVVDIIRDAFAAYERLGEYARAHELTRDEVRFSIKSEHVPFVKVSVLGLPAQKIEFPVTLSLDFTGATLVVHDGRVMSLRTGTCTGSGTLSCEKVELCKPRTAPLRLPGEIHFGDGIKLPDLPRLPHIG